MDFLHASIALLASMVLILAGMVGWLYWQQTRLFQNMNNIVMVIGELARPAPEPQVVDVEPVGEVESNVQHTTEDDRVSVEDDEPAPHESVDVVNGPEAAVDTDGLEDKSKKDLKDMLIKRGIPFGKNDGKNVLVSLLKAVA